jgi:hypothetical protein
MPTDSAVFPTHQMMVANRVAADEFHNIVFYRLILALFLCYQLHETRGDPICEKKIPQKR